VRRSNTRRATASARWRRTPKWIADVVGNV
jgi:hypothetical protein